MTGLQAALDHIVIRVDDLAQAADRFADAGFTITPGGRHPNWGSENALIVFTDRSYLELITFPPGESDPPSRPRRIEELAAAGADPIGQRVGSWAVVAPGLLDYALRPADMSGYLAALRARGIEVGDPLVGSRERPDGKRLAWQMAIPATLDLPFLCADITDVSLRIPGGDACRHDNGVLGIHRVCLLNEQPDSALQQLSALFDAEPASAPGSTSEFDLGGWHLNVAAPRNEAQRRQVAMRGAGPCRIELVSTGQTRLAENLFGVTLRD